MLARLDPRLLSPVQRRSAQAQAHLTAIRARAALVGARTVLVNSARGLAKSYEERLCKWGTQQVNKNSAAALSPELRVALDRLLAEVKSLNRGIAEYDRRIKQMASQVHPEVARLKQVKGVGTLIELTYVLTVGDPRPFGRRASDKEGQIVEGTQWAVQLRINVESGREENGAKRI